MNSLYLEVELLSPVAISAHAATVGGHETLTRIPGSQLLGATARLLRLDPSAPPGDEAWRILFSGEVRFGDCWPEADGQPAYLVPGCLHRPKGEREGPAFNLAVEDRPAGKQLEPLRDLHLTTTGVTVEPRRTQTLRTAIQEHGRSREGFLFGIESLDPGQRFLGRIDADDPSRLEAVRRLLDGQTLAIGRSRGAEFGEVRVWVREPWQAPPEGKSAQRVTLWLLSDLALRDAATGAPRLVPQATDFGLPGDWTVDWKRTFLRTRRWSPFNGARRRPDLERQVVEAGSVVTVAPPPGGRGWNDALAVEVRAHLGPGVGEHLEEGLGRVALNPALLEAAQVPIRRAAQQAVRVAPTPDDPLWRWLQERRTDAGRRDDIEDAARALERELAEFAIRPSQLGEIRRYARQARFRDDGKAWLHRELTALLASGARLHNIPDSARKVLVREPYLPEVLERAATRLSKPSKEPQP